LGSALGIDAFDGYGYNKFDTVTPPFQLRAELLSKTDWLAHVKQSSQWDGVTELELLEV